MALVSCKYIFPAFLACLAMLAAAPNADAKTTHHSKHHTTRHAHSKRLKKTGSEITRIAQRHLFNLGYYNGAIDGVMGPQTRLAIKNFQRDHHLKADGVLGRKTQNALEISDTPILKSNMIPTIQSGVVADIHPDFATSQNGNTKIIPSRFAQVDASESGTGANKRYAVNLNGQAILVADGQPSVIGISPTYDMGQEDAVIFTTYSPSDTNCMYRNHVLVMTGTTSQVLDIGNCTRNFQASVTGGSLYIKFGEADDARAVPATWRVEGLTAERL